MSSPLWPYQTTSRDIELTGAEGAYLHLKGGHRSLDACGGAIVDNIGQGRPEVGEAAEMGDALMRALEERLDQHPHVADIRGKGLMIGIEIVADRASLDQFPTDAMLLPRILRHIFLAGAMVYAAGNGEVRDCLLLGPPFILTKAEAEGLADKVARGIDAGIAEIAG